MANVPEIGEAATLSTLSAEDYFNQGNDLRDAGKYSEAIASFDKALELDPNYVNAWNNKGVSLHYLERYDEAIASYDKALELDPDYALAIKNRRLALEKIN